MRGMPAFEIFKLQDKQICCRKKEASLGFVDRILLHSHKTHSWGWMSLNYPSFMLK